MTGNGRKVLVSNVAGSSGGEHERVDNGQARDGYDLVHNSPLTALSQLSDQFLLGQHRD
jgi:hypothetical protein